jgi:hypothetical protein
LLELEMNERSEERFVDLRKLPLELLTMTMKMTKAESLEWRLGVKSSSSEV